MKELFWIGTSLDDLKAFPPAVRIDMGTDLRLIQQGENPRDWKPMPDVGPGTREIRARAHEGALIMDIEKGRTRYKLIP